MEVSKKPGKKAGLPRMGNGLYRMSGMARKKPA